MTDYKLAKIHKGCIVNDEYCEEGFYYGCEGCRFYDWIIDKIIEDLDDKEEE